jgi:hypothetical protein
MIRAIELAHFPFFSTSSSNSDFFMQFPFVDSSQVQYCIAVLAERLQYRCTLPVTTSTAAISLALRKPIKFRSKVALRLTRA